MNKRVGDIIENIMNASYWYSCRLYKYRFWDSNSSDFVGIQRISVIDSVMFNPYILTYFI